MQSLQIPTTFPSSLSSPLFFRRPGNGPQGESKPPVGSAKLLLHRAPLQDQGSLPLHSIARANCGSASPEPHPSSQAFPKTPALLCPGQGTAGPLGPAQRFGIFWVRPWVWCWPCWCPHPTWHTGRAPGREQGRWAHSKLLSPARAKPLPLGWLVSRLRWLRVNVKPLVGLPKGGEFEGAGRKEWQRLDGIFLVLSHTPRILLPARRPSRDLEKSLVYCCPFQLNFLPLSILDKRLYVTAALRIMPKQTCQSAQGKQAADLRLQCWVHAQLSCCIDVPSKQTSSNWEIRVVGGEIQSLGSPQSQLKCKERTGACRIVFLGQKGKFFVQFENTNTYCRLIKVKMNTQW